MNIFPEVRVLTVVPLGMDKVLPNSEKETETAIFRPGNIGSPVFMAEMVEFLDDYLHYLYTAEM